MCEPNPVTSAILLLALVIVWLWRHGGETLTIEGGRWVAVKRKRWWQR
jgi:hypothetical protein